MASNELTMRLPKPRAPKKPKYLSKFGFFDVFIKTIMANQEGHAYTTNIIPPKNADSNVLNASVTLVQPEAKSSVVTKLPDNP